MLHDDFVRLSVYNHPLGDFVMLVVTQKDYVILLEFLYITELHHSMPCAFSGIAIAVYVVTCTSPL